MRLLFSSDPFDKKVPDEAYAAEFYEANQRGLACSLFSAEDFGEGVFRPRPELLAEEQVLYRGWMLEPVEFAALTQAVRNKSGEVLTSPDQYRRCHYLPEWYSACKEFTPTTIIVDRHADFIAAVEDIGWSRYFVKDFVKSLTTERGSVAKTGQEISEIVDLIEKYRGKIEGGVCIREWEDLDPESEERYFVFRGTAFGRGLVVPEIVQQIAERIDSPFFSVDIVLNAEGETRLVELGDGQVSDRKKWSPSAFVDMLTTH